MDRADLLVAVEAAFASTGADTPPWPDPHEGDRFPAEDEYSRCLDPAKYRIFGARADAWVQALTTLGLAEVEEVLDTAGVWRNEEALEPDRASRLHPRRDAALPLLFGFRAMDDVPDTVVDVGAGDPALYLTTAPDCGCDACDDGSEPALDALDDFVLAVLTGELVHVRTRKLRVTATASGWSATGTGGWRTIDRLLAKARAGRSRDEVVRGEPWW